MIKTLFSLGLVSVLTSLSAQMLPDQEPLCDIEKKIVTIERNGQVVDQASESVVECTDNTIKRLFQVQSGMASNCGEFLYWTQIGGRNVQRKGISCQRPDGNWEVVNTSRWP
jgi:surface antigen